MALQRKREVERTVVLLSEDNRQKVLPGREGSMSAEQCDSARRSVSRERFSFEREAVRGTTCPVVVYASLLLAVTGGVLFIGGLAGLLLRRQALLPVQPSDLQAMLWGGFGGFVLFSGWFLCFFLSRHLLESIERLEKKLDDRLGEKTAGGDDAGRGDSGGLRGT